jgi:hypothetical protein
VNGDTVLSLMLVFTAVLGCVIGKRRGRPVLGLLLGFVMGPLGPVVIALVPRRRSGPWYERTGFAAQKLFSGGVRAGVIVGRRCVPAGTKWVRGERIYHPPTHDSQSGYGAPGRWDRTRIPERVPAQFWLKLRSGDGRSGWVQADEATYGFPDGHYVDLRS